MNHSHKVFYFVGWIVGLTYLLFINLRSKANFCLYFAHCSLSLPPNYVLKRQFTSITKIYTIETTTTYINTNYTYHVFFRPFKWLEKDLCMTAYKYNLFHGIRLVWIQQYSKGLYEALGIYGEDFRFENNRQQGVETLVNDLRLHWAAAMLDYFLLTLLVPVLPRFDVTS
jgi:hypothetical protein